MFPFVGNVIQRPCYIHKAISDAADEILNSIRVCQSAIVPVRINSKTHSDTWRTGAMFTRLPMPARINVSEYYFGLVSVSSRYLWESIIIIRVIEEGEKLF